MSAIEMLTELPPSHLYRPLLRPKRMLAEGCNISKPTSMIVSAFCIATEIFWVSNFETVKGADVSVYLAETIDQLRLGHDQ